MTQRAPAGNGATWPVRLARTARQLHRWIGVGLALIMAVLAVTGGFIAFKKQVEYLQPATRVGADAPIETLLTPAEVAERVLDLDLPEAQQLSAIDRIELHPGRGVYKVRLLAKDAWSSPREIQVDAATGAILNDGPRGDQLWMDLHSFAVFGTGTKLVTMSVAALAALWLSLSGLYLFFFPRWFRARKKRHLEQRAGAVQAPTPLPSRSGSQEKEPEIQPKKTGTWSD